MRRALGAVGGAAGRMGGEGWHGPILPIPDSLSTLMRRRGSNKGLARGRGRGSRAVACVAARVGCGRAAGMQEVMWAAQAARAGVGGARAGGSGYWPFEPHPSRRNGRVGSVAGRGTGAASGRQPHVRGDGGGARRARGSSGGHNSEAPALVEVGVGRGGSILERGLHPPPLAGPALAARDRFE